MKGDDSMMCPQEDINRYLEDTKELFKNNKYIISYNDNRRENYQLIMDYVISEYDKKMILLSITSDNFVKRESNTKEKYHNEIMYAFSHYISLQILLLKGVLISISFFITPIDYRVTL